MRRRNLELSSSETVRLAKAVHIYIIGYIENACL